MVTIEYNGSNPFSGIAPTPLVARSLTPVGSNRYGLKDSITLNGVITGDCNDGFQSIYEKYITLTNRFSDNFKDLQILENGSGIYTADYAYVKSISITDNKWWGIIPFSISLDAYDSDSFQSGKYGVSSSQNQFAFSENDDCTVSITQNVSAVGFNTSTGAYYNALNYVSSLTGWSDQVSPAFITGGVSPVLISVAEKPNRMQGSYGATLSYLYDKGGNIPNTSGLFKYSLEKSSGVDKTSVKINGEFIGGQKIDNSILRQNFDQIDFHSIASTSFQDVGLFREPVSFSSTENLSGNEISFSVEYSNLIQEDPYFVDKTKVTYDCLSNTVKMTVGGTVKSHNICSGFALAQNYYENIDVSGLAASNWADYGSGDLNYNFTSHSYSEDRVGKSINFSYGFSNEDYGPSLLDDCLEDFNYSLSFTPSINQYSAKPILDGEGAWAVTDMGFKKRARFSTNGSARVTECCSEESALAMTKTRLNQISSEYFDGTNKILESQTLKFNDETFVVNFSASWSAETSNVIP